MSGYLRGPSLTTHVFAAAVLGAVTGPLMWRALDSPGWGILAGLGAAALYGVAAALWAARRIGRE